MKSILKIVVLGLMWVSFFGCGGGGSDGVTQTPEENRQVENEPTNNEQTDNKEPEEQVPTFAENPSYYYGNWIYIADGRAEKIDKNFAYLVKSLGANFIEVTKEGKPYTLLRKGSNRALVQGRVYDSVDKLEKFDKEKQMKVTKYIPIFQKTSKLKNLRVTINDGFHKQHKKVDANGHFSFEKVNVGDIEIIIEGEAEDEEVESEEENKTITVFEDNITIEDEDNDVGNFQVPEEGNYNFKTTEVIDVQDEDDRYMYESRTYNGKLVFKNISDKVARGLNYTISSDDAYVDDLTHDMVLGSVEANQSVEIPFTVSFRLLDKIKHRVKLDFLIRDVKGKEWLDNVYLDVYQTPVEVNMKTKSSKLKGYFVTPEHDVLEIDTKDIKVTLPERPDGKYFFVVASPQSIGEETAYSVGVDVNASDFENFNDTSAFEPNNREEEASKLHVGDSVKSFIHKGDIDFYTIDFQNSTTLTPPALPFH